MSPANHHLEHAVRLSPFVWSFLGSEPCSGGVVLQPVCTLLSGMICLPWPRSSCGPVLEALRQERSSWAVCAFPKTSLPEIELFCPHLCGFFYIYNLQNFSFVLDWEV